MKTKDFNKKKKRVMESGTSRKKLQKVGRIASKKRGLAFRTKRNVNGYWELVTVPDPKRKQQLACKKIPVKKPKTPKKMTKKQMQQFITARGIRMFQRTLNRQMHELEIELRETKLRIPLAKGEEKKELQKKAKFIKEALDDLNSDWSELATMRAQESWKHVPFPEQEYSVDSKMWNKMMLLRQEMEKRSKDIKNAKTKAEKQKILDEINDKVNQEFSATTTTTRHKKVRKIPKPLDIDIQYAIVAAYKSLQESGRKKINGEWFTSTIFGGKKTIAQQKRVMGQFKYMKEAEWIPKDIMMEFQVGSSSEKVKRRSIERGKSKDLEDFFGKPKKRKKKKGKK